MDDNEEKGDVSLDSAESMDTETKKSLQSLDESTGKNSKSSATDVEQAKDSSEESLH